MYIKCLDQSRHIASTIKMCANIIYQFIKSLSFTLECELHEIGDVLLFGAIFSAFV